jgi:iron complex transport system substrate-binding protein
MRIVSLLPSTTEIIFDLGLADQLLGVTFECNFPPEARQGREIVVGGMDTKHLTPLEIDELVRTRLAAGDELYSLDDAALARCNPDLILSQDLCRVCAVPSGEVDLAVARLNCQATVLQIDPHSLVEVIDSVQTVADAAGVPERGQALVHSLHQRLTTLRERTDSHLAGSKRPTVFILEWIDPPFVGGHWVPDLVVAAGGQPVLALPGERSVPTTWDDIREADPDHIIVSPCGYGLPGAVKQAQQVLDQMPTRAAVWAIDADAVIVRPGPRLIDGAEALAAAFFGPEVAGLPALPTEVIQRLR